MRGLRLAVVGFGRLGRACAEAVLADNNAVLAGFVRRDPESTALPPPFGHYRASDHISHLGAVDAALVCVPTPQCTGVAAELLQQNIPVVECAELHGEAFESHFQELDRIALNHRVGAVVGAGWDPGALSLIRGLFALLTPRGQTRTSHRPGIDLHHTTAAEAVPGVRQALSTELRSRSGETQRYVYVELEPQADPREVEHALRGDPQYLAEETLVIPVDSIAALEEEGHGIVMERRGEAGGSEHQLLLLEGRYSDAALAGTVMTAAAHSLVTHPKGAHSLFELPPGSLWGALHELARRDWI